MSLPASVQLSKYDHPFRQPIGIKTALYEIAVTCTYLPHQSRTAPIHDRRLNAAKKKEEKITNVETNVSITTTTNKDGIYVISGLRPAHYRLTIQKEGFRTVVQPNLQLYVQDAVNENFTLALGSVSESSTVVGTPLLQTDSAAVSTVVDQQFVHNMPLNGRSFQSLIALTPGLVFTSQNLGQGQFSVNGQRTNANYFTWMA
jgi:hypothetical protein